MNEQLIVKNFGPIKDATVDFKRVTVFIGPTGGGKSTLAKLAAVFLSGQVRIKNNFLTIDEGLNNYGILDYKTNDSFINWKKASGNDFAVDRPLSLSSGVDVSEGEITEEMITELVNRLAKKSKLGSLAKSSIRDAIVNQLAGPHFNAGLAGSFEPYLVEYIPTERVFIPSIEYSWAGLMRDDIGLPHVLLEFANNFSLSRKEITELEINFFDVIYLHIDGRDFIKIPGREKLLPLQEAASGIQSVAPMLVLLEQLVYNKGKAQCFIVEEPELNLYPTAQQGLLNWLVEKCTKGENDLTITTHSPYILSHLNLLLYAYQVAEKHPDRAGEVAELVPRASWINPQEFACYQVENGWVTSLVNDDLGLIDDNGLDGLSGEAADAFDNLIRLSKGVVLK